MDGKAKMVGVVHDTCKGVHELNHTPWTIPSLKEYFEKQFDSLKEITDMERKLHALALEVAKKESERRLEGMNEFRDTLTDQANTFLTREIWDREHRNLVEKIDDLKTWRAVQEGAQSESVKISKRANVAGWVAIIISAVATVLHFVK
jgi:hypothetical protein